MLLIYSVGAPADGWHPLLRDVLNPPLNTQLFLVILGNPTSLTL